MKIKMAVLLTALACSGCMNTDGVIKALAADPASARIDIRSVYGTVTIIRSNPNTNTPPHSIAEDGAISVFSHSKATQSPPLPVAGPMGWKSSPRTQPGADGDRVMRMDQLRFVVPATPALPDRKMLRFQDLIVLPEEP